MAAEQHRSARGYLVHQMDDTDAQSLWKDSFSLAS